MIAPSLLHSFVYRSLRLYSFTPVEKLVYEKLKKSLNPTSLEIKDISGGCGSMFLIDIKSEIFKNLSIIKQHKLVNEVLKDEIKGWHGLQLRTGFK